VENGPINRIDMDGHDMDPDCSVCRNPNDSGYGFSDAGSSSGMLRRRSRSASSIVGITAGAMAAAGAALNAVGSATALAGTATPQFQYPINAWIYRMDQKIDLRLDRLYKALENVLSLATPDCGANIPNCSIGIVFPGIGFGMDAELAETSGILREAASAKGMAPGMGQAPVVTAARAQEIGEAWVGPGYRVSRNGAALVSKDGLRVYRPPTFKPSLGKWQANLEKVIPGAGKISDYHLDIR